MVADSIVTSYPGLTVSSFLCHGEQAERLDEELRAWSLKRENRRLLVKIERFGNSLVDPRRHLKHHPAEGHLDPREAVEGKVLGREIHHRGGSYQRLGRSGQTKPQRLQAPALSDPGLGLLTVQDREAGNDAALIRRKNQAPFTIAVPG